MKKNGIRDSGLGIGEGKIFTNLKPRTPEPEPRFKRIVIKIGTSLFVEESEFNKKYISEIVEDIATIRKKGIEVIIVSSGAVGSGMEVLGIKEYPKTIALRQAVAAVGQPELMDIYRHLFSKEGLLVSQILLTHNELSEKRSSLNILHTFSFLFKFGVIPIVNENDSVGIEELKIGDNDSLSAYVAILLNASCLIILTDKDGIYKLNNLSEFEELIPVIPEITNEIKGVIKGEKKQRTIGGMKTKITAAEMATKEGIPTIIASGKKKGILQMLMEGKREGTLFLPKKSYNPDIRLARKLVMG